MGQPARGNFSMSFQRGDGYGGGRSLEGRFASVAMDASFGLDLSPSKRAVFRTRNTSGAASWVTTISPGWRHAHSSS